MKACMLPCVHALPAEQMVRTQHAPAYHLFRRMSLRPGSRLGAAGRFLPGQVLTTEDSVGSEGVKKPWQLCNPANLSHGSHYTSIFDRVSKWSRLAGYQLTCDCADEELLVCQASWQRGLAVGSQSWIAVSDLAEATHPKGFILSDQVVPGGTHTGGFP